MDNKIRAEITNKYRIASDRLILLDYDGTLVNHTAVPHTAILPEDITDIIIKLADDPKTKLFIITGRGHEDIDRFLDHIPVNIIAEHGALVKEGGKWKRQLSDNFMWKDIILPIIGRITASCPESYVEEKMFSVAWHYRNSDPVLGFKCSRELIDLLKKVTISNNLRILDGNKVVEVLTNETGKGIAVKNLYNQNNFDFVLSIGDDVTDEEMFEFFLHHPVAFTVKVGEGATNARYKFNTITDVILLLKQLSG
jgi:trehalose 6-phosphate synthase/phosphatase